MAIQVKSSVMGLVPNAVSMMAENNKVMIIPDLGVDARRTSGTCHLELGSSV